MLVEREVLERIRPSAEQERQLERVVRDIVTRVRQLSHYFETEVEPMVAGSVAKGTHLRDPDIDIFMLFPPEMPMELMADKGMAIARSIMDGEERYAQHPYLRGNYEGFMVDLVPAYRLPNTKELQTAVDRTPFHVVFVNGHLKAEQRDEVRLLKQFLKGIGTYGAEEATQGFSGYLVELLVMRYGTFQGALKGLLELPQGRVLDLFDTLPEAERPAPSDVGKFEDPLVFVDPVDPKRNVASPLSAQSLGLTRQAAREYLEAPTMRFFFPARPDALTPERLRNLMEVRETKVLAIALPVFHENPDVVHGQLRKAVKAINRICNLSGFPVLHADHRVVGKECLILLELEVAALPVATVHHGPMVGVGNDGEFVTKWSKDGRTLAGPYVEDGQWRVDVLRQYTHVEELLRVELLSLNLGKQVNKELEQGVRLLSAEELLVPAYAEALTAFLKRIPPWRWGEVR